MDLPGHPLPLVQDPSLPGLRQQLLAQARVLGQRGLQLALGLAHLGEGQLTPVLLLVVVPVEPGQGAHRQHVDGQHGEIGRHAQDGALVDAGRLRGARDHRDRGHARQPPRPAQDREREEAGCQSRAQKRCLEPWPCADATFLAQDVGFQTPFLCPHELSFR